MTRRGFFDKIMLTAVGVSAMVVAGAKQAEAKVAKSVAKYRGSSYKGRKCAGCNHYRGNGKCALVSGSVSSNGYCNYYSKKSGYKY